MKIFITGIAGAIGSHMAERLLKEGHDVVGVDALTPYYSPDIKKINIVDVEKAGGKVFIRDLVTDDISPLLDSVDFIFHFAAQPGISSSTSFEEYLRNNIIATEKLFKASRQIENFKGFIHASTSSVYGAFAGGDEESVPRPTSHYGVTKLAAEQLVLSYARDKNFPATVLRFFSVYGERERPEKLYHKLIKAVLEEKEFTIYKGAEKHIRSYTYVSDIIDGCMLVLNDFEKAKGEIFNLGNDTTMTTGEGIDLIQEIIGKKGKFIELPPRSGDQLETSANISKMRKIFGYNPKVQLKEGLEKMVKWYEDKIFVRQEKEIGLIIRVFSLTPEGVPDRVGMVKRLVEKANTLGIFARIDIYVPINKKYEHSDCGYTISALKKENLEKVFIHESVEDVFCGVLNNGIQVHYTQGIAESLIVSPEAEAFFSKENIYALRYAIESGAKVSGIILDLLQKSITEGRITNTFALWDNWALMEVGGFDLEARAPYVNEERPYAGVEEIKPIIRLIERYGKCIAPVKSASDAHWIAPDKIVEPEAYEQYERKVMTKYTRQKYYTESLGKDFDFIKEGIMTIYQ